MQAPINAHFEALFETGVDEMLWDVVGDDNVSLLLLLLLLLLSLLLFCCCFVVVVVVVVVVVLVVSIIVVVVVIVFLTLLHGHNLVHGRRQALTCAIMVRWFLLFAAKKDLSCALVGS